MEDVGDGLGRIEEEDRAPQAKASEAEGEAPELDRPKKISVDATPDASIVADAELAQTEGAATAEVVASHLATDEVAAGDIAAAGASSSPTGLGDLCEAMGEAMTEVL
jgi:hypothetical protein